MVDSVAVRTTHLPGVIIIRNRRFHDARGFFVQSYSKRDFAQLGISEAFVQDNLGFNIKAPTLRGLHFQREPFAQAKLVTVVRGRVLDVVVDLRRGSPTFGEHLKVTLSDAEGEQLFVPPGFAHGYLTHQPETLLAYKVSKPYSPQHEGGLCFDDRLLDIDWGAPTSEIVISDRDRSWPEFDPRSSYFK
jgi:dTDP-4-dehydrorhamnose 3,5-epimerase